MVYDVIVVGAGPAGLTAGIYGARARLKTLIIEKGLAGGQISSTREVANYPGFLEEISGAELGMLMAQQADKFGAERILSEVLEMRLEGDIKEVDTLDGTFKGKTVILAMGSRPRPIGVKGEEKFQGKGMSYCVTCDGAFYSGKEVYVLGGGDAAVEEAMALTKFVEKVTIIHRRDELRAAKSIQEKAFENPKIDFMWDTVVEELRGETFLTGMVVKNVKTGELTEINGPAGEPLGVFLYIGFLPETGLVEGQVALERGYVKADENMVTSVPGVFVAGDLREKTLRQVVTATADGAIAAFSAEKYLNNLE